ncbi:hypothetical protein EVAR_10172_1 [Eumeta japonica]|uniref:Uncharacterized protein n=1 Tax=Eumeta variegata TaxID=151549 RepID=A0A4C1TD88_EUMVA|nr:hypothetical protein EVAR_10172_1 [Eumeta japonica]
MCVTKGWIIAFRKSYAEQIGGVLKKDQILCTQIACMKRLIGASEGLVVRPAAFLPAPARLPRSCILPTSVNSGITWFPMCQNIILAVDGRITTALRGCRCVRRLVDKEIGEVRGGRTSHWPRGKRRAHGKAAALGAQRCYMSAARHSQSAFNRRRGNTLYPSSETKFWSALRPPLVSQCKKSAIQRKKVRSPTGLVSFGGPASSTVRRRTVNPDAPAALIPMSGGVTIDHSASERVPTTSPVPPARAVSRAASVSSRSTQASRAARLRMEYEAAEELAAIQKQDAEIRRELVKKRLAMNLAEIEAATECDEAEEHAVHRTEDSARRGSLDREHTTGSERHQRRRESSGDTSA